MSWKFDIRYTDILRFILRYVRYKTNNIEVEILIAVLNQFQSKIITFYRFIHNYLLLFEIFISNNYVMFLFVYEYYYYFVPKNIFKHFYKKIFIILIIEIAYLYEFKKKIFIRTQCRPIQLRTWLSIQNLYFHHLHSCYHHSFHR